jgi:hypothetical protein
MSGFEDKAENICSYGVFRICPKRHPHACPSSALAAATLHLAYLGFEDEFSGVLLWPAAVVHPPVDPSRALLTSAAGNQKAPKGEEDEQTQGDEDTEQSGCVTAHDVPRLPERPREGEHDRHQDHNHARGQDQSVGKQTAHGEPPYTKL